MPPPTKVPPPVAAERSPASRDVRRGWLIRGSLIVNTVFAVAALGIGARRLWMSRKPSSGDVYADERRSLHEALPARPGAIVFLGDSLTDRGAWSEMFDDARIANRGIAGDTTAGILARAPKIAAQRPAKVLLCAGVNDLGAGDPIDAIAARYGAILDTFRRASPETALVCESVLPVRPPLAPAGMTNARIRALNEAIRRVAAERSCAFVDLWPALADADGALPASFTLDGVHLTGAGYVAWGRAIEPFVRTAR